MVRALLFLVLLCGCGWKSDGLERLEMLYPTKPAVVPDSGEPQQIDLGTPRCTGLDGRWAVRLTQRGTIDPLGTNMPWGMTVTDLFLADSTAQGIALRFCDQQVAITNSGGASDLGRSKVPAALQQVLNATPVNVPLPGDGTFRAQDVVWTWGLKGLTDPLNEVLPAKDTYVGDARVWDQDDDGRPGTTLQILSPPGDRAMVRRAIWTFGAGKLTFDNQWLTGTLTAAITESGLQSSNSLLLTVAPITPKADGTVYQLRCVGPSYSCASLSAEHGQVFKNAPK